MDHSWVDDGVDWGELSELQEPIFHRSLRKVPTSIAWAC